MRDYQRLTEDECIRFFETERCRFNHDLLHNEFFMRLGPSWHDGRLGPDDAVFYALLGDQKCREQVTDALRTWRDTCFPVFYRLSDGVAAVFGFVVTDAWLGHAALWDNAANELNQFVLPQSGLAKHLASQEALKFWSACDVVKHAVLAWREHFSEFISRWDGTLIKTGGTT